MSPRGKLSPPTEPIHEVLAVLAELKERLAHCGGGGPQSESAVELYDTLVRGSEWGRDCQFAKKTQLMFETYDYKDIGMLILKVVDAIRKISPDFGK